MQFINVNFNNIIFLLKTLQDFPSSLHYNPKSLKSYPASRNVRISCRRLIIFHKTFINSVPNLNYILTHTHTYIEKNYLKVQEYGAGEKKEKTESLPHLEKKRTTLANNLIICFLPKESPHRYEYIKLKQRNHNITGLRTKRIKFGAARPTGK